MSLRSRILLGTVLIILSCSISIGLFSWHFANRAILQDMRVSIGVSLLHLAQTHADDIRQRRESSLWGALNGLAANQRGAEYAFVMDAAGSIVAHTDIGKVGTMSGLAPVDLVAAQGSEAGFIEQDQRRVFYQAVSEKAAEAKGEEFLFGERDNARRAVGWVVLALSKRDIERIPQRIFAAIFMIVLANLAVFSALAWLFSGRIAAPLRELARAIRYLNEKGVTGTASRLKVDSSDELGLVARAFNKMADDLYGAWRRIEDQNQTLEIKVEERTRKLKEAQAMLAQAEKLSAVGQLAAGVAHEINNPLGIILGFSQSLLRRIESRDGMAMPLQSIEREALRCKSLVENLLIFSRTQNADKKEVVELNSMLGSAVLLLKSQTKIKNVDIVLQLCPESVNVEANRTQVQQILINLGSNAIDAMPKGGTLTIRTLLSKARPGFAEVQVQDTGEGISADARSHIFEPFFTTKEVGKGTGLGLSLVYEIVQKHKGGIEFDSVLGQGTTFVVYLPIVRAAQAGD
ncbi:MAG TPA: hypothetical protein DEB40_12925 [Elusimicrobia bacterium]|nr:hypothetical protein [Elusimicrobiota bacterium]HBT62637.1 hypothetical protein [Elusimicrobiota bacterium]